MTSLHDEVLDRTSRQLFASMGAEPAFSAFYLAGGTGLALQLGHRVSLDLDLFTERAWRWDVVAPVLARWGDVAIDLQDAESFVGTVGGVRVSLFHYQYLLLEAPVQGEYGLPIASLTDIGCMKLVAASQRGSRKDFVDLYFLGLAGISAIDLLDALGRKAPGMRYNPIHIARSLAYFDDAEAEPEPRMLMTCEWAEVKRYCAEQAREILKDSLAE